MKMTTVIECAMESCAYNKEMACHAKAITIGGHGCPECDTMSLQEAEAGDVEASAGVGACKVANCIHNERLECTASDIAVGQFGNTAACKTFESST
jgi:hypothetical protein